MLRIRRWLRQWEVWLWMIRKQRRKKHGAGKAPWGQALKIANDARYLVYGQFYTSAR